MATQNWWEADPVAPANDPSFTGYIPGTPKPPKPEEPPSGFRWTNGPGSSLEPIPGGPADTGGGNDMMADAIKGLGVDELLNNVKKARDAVDGGYATGITGSVLSRIPGTSAADFHGYIDAIQGGIILEKMQALKDASKTGASGLGALSEKEGERLAASVASIKPNMSDQALRDSLTAIEQHANFLRAVQDGKDPRDPAVAKEYGLTPSAATDSGQSTKRDAAATVVTPALAEMTGGDPPPPDESAKIGVGELTPEQKNAYANFWKQNPNPTPDQLTGFLSGIGINNVDNAAEIIKAAKTGQGFSATTINSDYQSKVRQTIAQDKALGIDESPISVLRDQGATLNLSDEVAGFGNALANVVTSPFTGTFDPVTSYRVGRDAERMRIDDARQQLGYGGTAIELASGLASAGPGALELIAPKEAAQTAGRAGAVGGALSGYGSGDGTADSTVKGAGGALAGYALGRYAPALAGKGSGLLPKRFRAPRGMAPDVADAAAAEGVDLIRPMVDPNSVSDFGALESNVYSQPIIRGAQGRIAGQIEDRVAELAPDGTPLETEAAGGIVQDAARRFIQRSKGVAKNLYSIAKQRAGDAKITPRAALGQLRHELLSLRETGSTNAGEIGFIESLGEDLTKGPLSVDAFRNLRTSVRGRIMEQNLSATQAEARASRVLDALQKDALDSLPPSAANAFRRADMYYRERMVHIDDVLDRFLGGNVQRGQARLSGEQAFNRLKSMTSPGGDGRRLGALMRDLEPSERQDIAATIAQSLGRRASDEPFSTALFLSQARKLSPSARRTIFGPDGAQSIDNLRLLARKLEDAGKDINRSRSATVLERQGWRNAARAVISGLAGISGTAATGSVAGGAAALAVAGTAMGASAARRVLSARAMVNPRVSRWLAEAADISTERQAKEATRKLGVIIAREPALANELQPVYQALQQRLSAANPMPLAAEPQSEGNDDER